MPFTVKAYAQRVARTNAYEASGRIRSASAARW
jgi:hypothetical protein